MIITTENGRDIRLSGITPNDKKIVPWLDDIDYVVKVSKPKLASEVVVSCRRGKRDIVINNIKLLQEVV